MSWRQVPVAISSLDRAGSQPAATIDGGANMSVLALGVEDALGLRSVEHFARAGHSVSVAGARNVLKRLRTRMVRLIDGQDGASIRAAIERHDVICNLLCPTDSPQGQIGYAFSGRRRRRRRALLASIADGLAATNSETRLIQRSSPALYADGGSAWVTENSPVQPNRTTALAAAAERIVAEHVERGGSAVALRFAQPYGPDGAWTDRMLGLARRGWLPLEGPEDAYFPTIHVDDGASAVMSVLAAASGCFNVSDTDPLTNEELNFALGIAVGNDEHDPLHSAFRLPDLELLERSCRLDAGALERATGWKAQAAPSVAAWLVQLQRRNEERALTR